MGWLGDEVWRCFHVYIILALLTGICSCQALMQKVCRFLVVVVLGGVQRGELLFIITGKDRGSIRHDVCKSTFLERTTFGLGVGNYKAPTLSVCMERNCMYPFGVSSQVA